MLKIMLEVLYNFIINYDDIFLIVFNIFVFTYKLCLIK